MKDVLKSFGICLVVSFACVTVPATGQGQPKFLRTIAGVVVDKDEQPVADAKVCAWGTGGMGNRLPCGQSNTNGGFAINVDRPDTYTISAEQLAQGYPEAIFGFYGKLFCDFPVVKIDNASSVAPVKIKLGPKAGRVIFTIVDGRTNRPVTGGTIIVSRINDPLSYWKKGTSFPGGSYELLTPDAPFTVRFETWEGHWVKRAAFDPSGGEIKVLQLALGERKEITVRLK